MTYWTVTIAGNPPSINESYKVVYHGARCHVCGRGQPTLGKTAGVETWQEQVAWEVRAARPNRWVPARRTVIEIDWFMYREGRDADGPIKALLDGIKVGLGCDDKGFLPRVLSNQVDKKAPRTVIRIANEYGL